MTFPLDYVFKIYNGDKVIRDSVAMTDLIARYNLFLLPVRTRLFLHTRHCVWRIYLINSAAFAEKWDRPVSLASYYTLT